MNPTSELTDRRFRAVGRKILRLGVPALLAVTALMVVVSVPAGATRAPRIKKPGAPTAVYATPFNAAAMVSWTAPASDGGSPVTGYTVTASQGRQSCTTTDTTACMVTGLANGHLYTIKVRASNAIGMGKVAKVQVTPSSSPDCADIAPEANLQGCNLSGSNLTGANIGGANLTDANLTDANLTDANLTDAALGGAYLTGTNLSGANLSGADLTVQDAMGVSSGGITGTPYALPSPWILVSGYLVGPTAYLAGAELTNADLSGADLTNADLEAASVSNANLSGANLTGASLYFTNMTDATLTDANLSGADLMIANLSGVVSGGITGTPSVLPGDWNLVDGYLVGPLANLTGANLTDANLSSADLGYATLTDANLSGADLSGVDLNRVISGGIIGTPSALPSGWLLVDGYLIGQAANLTDANLNGANLTDADLEFAELIGATLANANLSSAELSGADLYDVASGGITGTPSTLPNDSWSIVNGYLVGPGANLTDAMLSGADLSGIDLTTSNLTGANLSGANLAGVTWSNTTCPDRTNSDNDGDTCINNLG